MDHYEIDDVTDADSYSLDDWLAEESYCNFESFWGQVRAEYQEYQTYGAIWEEADCLAELEAAEEVLLEEDAYKDPMYRLEQTIEGAKEFGCEHDKCFAWEGLDLLSQENVEEHCGSGEPSQWTY